MSYKRNVVSKSLVKVFSSECHTLPTASAYMIGHLVKNYGVCGMYNK